jgi:HEAT repeat protein
MHVLLNGTPDSRRAAALGLLERHDEGSLMLLVGAVRSTENWHLRARCLEALGAIAAESRQAVAERILGDCSAHRHRVLSPTSWIETRQWMRSSSGG